MPLPGYIALMLRRELYEKIKQLVDELYHGHTINSAILLAKKELEDEKLKVKLHDIEYPTWHYRDHYGVNKHDFATVTTQTETYEWLKKIWQEHKEEYAKKYGAKSVVKLGPFASRFLLNIFLSKREATDKVIRLKPEDYEWLQEEFKKKGKEYRKKYGVETFEQFLPIFIKETLEKMKAAKEIFTV